MFPTAPLQCLLSRVAKSVILGQNLGEKCTAYSLDPHASWKNLLFVEIVERQHAW